MAAQPDWLPSILAEEDFQKYHAFFNTFKHNHKAHSTIAYARLGASEERVKHHCKVKNERYCSISLGCIQVPQNIVLSFYENVRASN